MFAWGTWVSSTRERGMSDTATSRQDAGRAESPMNLPSPWIKFQQRYDRKGLGGEYTRVLILIQLKKKSQWLIFLSFFIPVSLQDNPFGHPAGAKPPAPSSPPGHHWPSPVPWLLHPPFLAKISKSKHLSCISLNFPLFSCRCFKLHWKIWTERVNPNLPNQKVSFSDYHYCEKHGPHVIWIL